MRLRPKRSPSAAAVINITAKLRLYALTVHSSWETDAPRSVRIVGRAVDTTSTSSAAMNELIAVSTTTQAIELLLLVACGLIGSPSVPGLLAALSELEIRRDPRINRSRRGGRRESARRPRRAAARGIRRCGGTRLAPPEPPRSERRHPRPPRGCARARCRASSRPPAG